MSRLLRLRSANHGAAPLRMDIAVAGLAGVIALAVFVRSLAPGLLWGDSAEFQFAAWLGGFAHPTGYPLYLMLGWLWTHLLPLGDPAWRMNLFSAFWGGIAVMLLCLLVMRLIRFFAAPSGRETPWVSRLIALGAALVFTFTPAFWSQAIIAEVYTLHAAFVAGLLLALVTWAERTMGQDADGACKLSYLNALLFGLSLAHHRSTILLIPAAALFVLMVRAGSGWRLRFSLRQAALLLLCLLAPLLLYLYIPLRAPHVSYYTLPLTQDEALPLYDSTVAGFLAHVSGSIFSSALAAPGGGALNPGQLVGRFTDELSINGLVLGAIGLAHLVYLVIRDRSRRAGAVLALTGVFFVAQVAFNLFYAIGDIHVFYIPAYLVWVLWMGIGAWALVRLSTWLFAGQSQRLWRWAHDGAALLALVVLLAFAYRSAVVHWPRVQRADDDSARRAWDALLAADIPADAILVSNDRDEMVPLWYLTYVEGQRPDLTGVFPLIQPGPAWLNVGRVLDATLQTGRPVHLVKPMPGLEIKTNLTPLAGESVGGLGPLQAVQAFSRDPLRQSVYFDYGEALRLLGITVDSEPLMAGATVNITLHWQPLVPLSEDWTTFVQITNSNGDKIGQSDHQPGGVYYPSSQWGLLEEVRDVHTITLAPDLGPGPYCKIVGVYVREGESFRYLGEPKYVGAC